jgi:hypothetical protein
MSIYSIDARLARPPASLLFPVGVGRIVALHHAAVLGSVLWLGPVICRFRE